MKKVLVLLLFLGTAAYAFTTDPQLERLANRVAMVVRDQGYRLNPRESNMVRQHLLSILQIFRDDNMPNPPLPPPPPPRPMGFYCSVACMSSNGEADLRYTSGASGNFEAEAKQNARSALRASFSCSRGAVDVSCAPTYAGQTYHAVAACTDSNGGPDLRYTGMASANNEEEASEMARADLRRLFSCQRGAQMFGSDSEWDGAQYCIVGCLDANGDVDARFTVGASGQSQMNAVGLAFLELRRKFSCSRGAKVDSCSR